MVCTSPFETNLALQGPVSKQAIRPKILGKFIFLGNKKLYIRGVTYGTFRPNIAGDEFHDRKAVERDFALMASNGINAIRTYNMPPCWILDTAQRYGLHVMIGLAWEQHITFLDDKKRVRSIEERVRAGVRACAHHPAVLCYVIGNEIPSNIVRWYGRRRVERFLKRLYRVAKAEDPGGLITYVNYPSTEYLQLPFLDFVCFNVYLEEQERLASYLARLQNIAGDRPLMLAEIGLDSRRHGEDVQAKILNWQIRTAFTAGCAGAFVFAWTDEWHRGGYDIEDWDFGITDRKRRPKPALRAVQEAYAEVPFPPNSRWPRISVVVCSYNGERTIRECLSGLEKLEYPNYEVIVVNDGSTDSTADIVSGYGFRLISTENRGLSSARNTGMEAATGEIVAYIDDDAYPDPHWLTYLAATFMTTTHVAVGGPNIAPPGDGLLAACVANAPGGPTHVLLTDHEAEHIPGCNMAFRKAALQEVGGFDSQFRIAGDDVDLCWKLRQRGWTLGFSPSALVWHHRRNSVRAYWKQQQGYGKAEALLERKWPEKYTAVGHLAWSGRIYDKGGMQSLGLTWGRVLYGTWGSALFQSLYHPTPGLLQSLPLMPEWYLIITALVGLSVQGVLWAPLLLALPMLFFAVGVLLVQAILHAVQASFTFTSESRINRVKFYSLTTLLHLLQPLARLWGRWRYGLTPWRQRLTFRLSRPFPQTSVFWSEQWRSPSERLQAVETALKRKGVVVLRGGEYDRWDLEVRGGVLGRIRTLMTIEEHGTGRQLIRFRSWPRFSLTVLIMIFLFAALSAGAAHDQCWAISEIMGLITLLLSLRVLQECAAATAIVHNTLRATGEPEFDAMSDFEIIHLNN